MIKKILMMCATMIAIVAPAGIQIDQLLYSQPLNNIDLTSYTDVWIEYIPKLYDIQQHLSYVRQNFHKHDFNLTVVLPPGDTAPVKGLAKIRLRRVNAPCCVLGPYSCTTQIRVFSTDVTNMYFGTCNHTPKHSTLPNSNLSITHLLLTNWLEQSRSFVVDTTAVAPNLTLQHDPPSVYAGGTQREPDQARYNDNKTNDDDVAAFPTDAAERKRDAKRAAKLRGEEWIVNKQKKYVEPHYDDCGEDYSAIDCETHVSKSAKDAETEHYLAADTDHDAIVTDSDEDNDLLDLERNASGMEQFAFFGPLSPGIPNVPEHVDLPANPRQLIAHLQSQQSSTSTFLELTQCANGTGRLTARRGDAQHRTDAITTAHYDEVETRDTLTTFLVTQPPTMLALSSVGHDSSLVNYAYTQLQHKRHFVAVLQETPNQDWRALTQHPDVTTLHSAPTTIITTSQAVVDTFTTSQRPTLGIQGNWSYTFATTLAESIQRHQHLYPEIAAGPDSDPTDAAEATQAEAWRKCDGCRWRVRRDDPAHTRVVGECKYPHDTTETWNCPGCKTRSPRFHHTHNYKQADCKWATAPSRSSVPRKGAHPRPGRQRATADPTAGLPGNTGEGELGAEDEKVDQPASSSTAVPDEPPDSGTASSSRGTRGPDTVDRERRTWADTATGSDRDSDWSKFEVGTIMRALRSNSEAGRRRILRKLHLRWWHATAAQMRTVLGHAQQPKEVIDLVDSIVDTCSVCRMWSKPLPSSIATSSISTKFNDHVEADLLFYKKHVILHMIDRCIRWHAAKVVSSRHMDQLIGGIDDIWVKIHGPMKEFIMDGETAIARDYQAHNYFQRKGIKVLIRAPGMHARFIERRGALLRDALHKIDTQLAEEGITEIPIEQRLNEAVFAGNAMLSINGTTPYNALYGRVPNILPDINVAQNLDDTGALPGTIRHSHRLREISVQRIVQSSATERIQRALKTRTLPAAQTTYAEGDDVDFFRPPANKDLPGWTGPAKVVDMQHVTRGVIKVRHNNRDLDCSPKDLRPHLAYLCFLAAPHPLNHVDRAFSTVRHAIEHLSQGRILTLGHICPKESWTLAKDTTTYSTTWNATRHIAEQLPDLEQLVAARYGKDMAVLPPTSEYMSAILIC